MTVRDEALAAVERGWSVIPVKPDSKLPAGEWKQAQSLLATLREVESIFSNQSESNYGIVTGAISGIGVLDIDARSGGNESANSLFSANGGRPTTPIAQTPGGYHMYFRYPPEGLRNSASRLGNGLDIRGEGGFVVGVGSSRPEGTYRWVNGHSPDEVPLAPFPDFIFKALAKPTGAEPTHIDGGAIPEGHRHDTLTRLAGKLRRDGLEPDTIEVALLSHNKQCNPPLPTEEVRSIARSSKDWHKGQTPTGSGATSVMKVTRLADVATEPVRWLWSPRVPLSKITILAGDPGVGKTYALYDLAARMSVGGETPDGDSLGPPASVVVLSAEDGIGDTIRPRVEGQGGNPAHIYVVESMVAPDGSERMLSLQTDLAAVEQVLTSTGARLLIVDPINAYTGKVDGHKDSDVRQVLSPLKLVAERTGAAIVCVMHFNKSSGPGTKAIYRVISSIGFTAAARSVLVVAPMKDDPETRVLMQIKNSLERSAPALTFTINEQPALVWGGVIDLDADELLGQDTERVPNSTRAEAIDFLEMVLADGALEAGAVKQEASAAGVTDKALRKAREELGINREDGTVYRDASGPRPRWYWKLPHEGGQVAPHVPDHRGSTYSEQVTSTSPQVDPLPTTLEGSTYPREGFRLEL